MKIEIWSDFTCPWCYIAKATLDQALKENNMQTEYIYHSYQTVPQGYYPKGKSFSIYEIAKKSGMDINQAIQKAALIEKMGKEAGISLNMNDVKMTDTTNAHRLLKLAHEYNLQDAFMMASYEMVFTSGGDLSNKEVLKELALGVGLPDNHVMSLLDSDIYAEDVMNDIKSARKKGISGVPYFQFNGNQSLYGAQPIEAFQNILDKYDSPTHSYGMCGFEENC